MTFLSNVLKFTDAVSHTSGNQMKAYPECTFIPIMGLQLNPPGDLRRNFNSSPCLGDHVTMNCSPQTKLCSVNYMGISLGKSPKSVL